MNEDLDILICDEPDYDIFSKLEVSIPDKSPISYDIIAKELSSEESPYTLSLRRSEFNDEKDRDRFINSVEKIIRTSPEYRLWTEYLRESLGQYTCALTGEVHSQTNVDIHHHPVTLYLIVKAVITKYLDAGKDFCSYDIATDTIELHYENKIGYVPIVKSLHDKFHRGFLQIPMEFVHGEWKYIVYQFNYEDDDLEIIESRLSVNKKNCGYGHYKWMKKDSEDKK